MILSRSFNDLKLRNLNFFSQVKVHDQEPHEGHALSGGWQALAVLAAKDKQNQVCRHVVPAYVDLLF